LSFARRKNANLALAGGDFNDVFSAAVLTARRPTFRLYILITAKFAFDVLNARSEVRPASASESRASPTVRPDAASDNSFYIINDKSPFEKPQTALKAPFL
jgi:hypothetical protein